MPARVPKTALITGAEGALGALVARRFLDGGCQVIGTYLKDKPYEDRIHWVRMDVTRYDSIDRELSALGLEIEALVHCAGGFRFMKADEHREVDFNFLIDTNLRSSFFLVQRLLPEMKARNFGRLVFISSKATLQAGAGMGAYAATKAGINALTTALADEVRSFDINVNAVLPTVIDTPANRRDMPSADFSTWVAPEALAEIIFSLTQPWGKSIHGALVPVAGRLP